MRARVVVIVNTGAGSVDSKEQVRRIEEAFEAAEISATVRCIHPGEDFEKLVGSVVNGDAEVIVAAGGDGTVSGIAAEVVSANKILGILPLGTLNHFSKDLQIPEEIDEAVRVIADNFVRQVDIAEVNGRSFINNSSIGLYPRIVRKRELQERLGRGKWWASVWAASRFLWISPFQKVRLELEGKDLWRKTPFLFVGNNRYEMDLYKIGTRPRLDEGKLSVYLLRRGSRTGLLMLILRTLVGQLKQSDDFEEFYVDHLAVETRKRLTLVAMDGEVAAMESPLEYRTHPRKLRVIAPKGRSK